MKKYVFSFWAISTILLLVVIKYNVDGFMFYGSIAVNMVMWIMALWMMLVVVCEGIINK